MKWIKYCNLFSLLDPWGKMWTIRALPWGVRERNSPVVVHFRGAQCLVEDERLRKCVISDGSSIQFQMYG